MPKGVYVRVKQPVIERFRAKVKVLENGCHEWQGSRLTVRKGEEAKPGKGHGQFRTEGHTVLAHRWSWEHLGGNDPPGDQCVLHKCDNPRCVNPEHLFLGTNADNTADKMAKGRYRNGFLVGEALKCSKLTEDKVRAIRELHLLPETERPSQRKLAKLFHISQGVISQIVNRKTWKHID